MLRELLAQRPDEEPVFIFEDRCVTAGELRSMGQGDGDYALRLDDPLSLASAVVALDGSARRVLLLPPGLDGAQQARLLEEAAMSEPIGDGSGSGGLRAYPWSRLGSGPLRRHDTHWILATSGTTGPPKLVQHSLASLTRLTNRKSRAGRGQRWGLLYDISRFAGLQVLLQAVIGGSILVLTRPEDPLSARLEQLIAGGCGCLSATPTLWRQILMSPLSRDLRLRQVTLGGEIADQATLDALRARFPQARLAHIYASTEAGAGFSVTDGRSGFPARFLDEAPRGVELRIVDGRLRIRNPFVTSHYLGRGEAFADGSGFVDSGDLVRRDGDRVHFLGRSNGSINVGGNKVHPEEVESILLESDLVQMARVTGRPSPITGELVVAEIVPSAGNAEQAALTQAMKAHCRARLAPYKRPASIRIVESLEVAASGKIARPPA